MAYIGIDLGTTNCCCAISKKTTVVINGEDGKNLVASKVFFANAEGKIVIGNGAEAQKKDSGVVIYGSKRLIGRKFKDPKVQDDKKILTYEIVGDEGTDDVLIKVAFNNTVKNFKPEEISSYLLKKIKSNVESKSIKVEGAVITVPAYFGTNQREKTKKAAELAGLNVIDIIDEPTAAALAYGYEEGSEAGKERTLLVYDFGGGTFDVSIIKVKGSGCEVICVGGDSHLGGEDITNNLVNYFCDLYLKETGEDLRTDKRKVQKLRTLKNKCDALKIDLSSLSESSLEYEMFEDSGVECKLTLSTFNEINKQIFDNTIKMVDDTIKRSKLKIEDIEEIVLVGGSCRNIRVKELLVEHYPAIKLKEDLNPDEIVAKGAAILAKSFSDKDNNCSKSSSGNRGRKVLIKNIVSHSLGIQVANDKIVRMIERGIERGKKVAKLFSNTSSTEFRFVVCEGESNDIKKNTLVGLFRIDGFPPSEIGSIQIKVVFEVDDQGVLNISVYNSSYGLNKTLVYEL